MDIDVFILRERWSRLMDCWWYSCVVIDWMLDHILGCVNDIRDLELIS